MKLNRFDSAINRENRAKLNENMSIIENDFSNTSIEMKDLKETVEENSRLVNQANLNASRAVILSNSVQDELDSIVVEGDSSVEAAAARTNTNTGETYSSLRARLDDENETLTQKSAQNKEKIEQITKQIHPLQSSAQIQEILNSSGQIRFLSGNYLLSPLYIKSNTVLEFDPDVTFTALDNYEERECILNFDDIENVVIYGNGSVLKMNDGIYTSGEWRHGISIRGSKSITIYDLIVKDTGGDGFYIGANKTDSRKASSKINIQRCQSTNNRRQGMSIITVTGMYVSDSIFEKSIGTNPKSGLDIEPNNSYDKLTNIVFERCSFLDNDRQGVILDLHNLNGTSNPVDIVFRDCVSAGNNFGYRVSRISPQTKGTILFENCRSENNDFSGYYELDVSGLGIKRILKNVISTNDNSSGGSDEVYGYGSAFYGNAGDASITGNIEMHDCHVYDDNSKILRGFAWHGNKTNILLDQCVAHNYTTREYHISNGTNIKIFRKDKVIYDLTANATASPYLSGYEIVNATKATLLSITFTHEEGNFYRVRNVSDVGIRIISSVPINGISTSTFNNIKTNTIGAYIEIYANPNGTWDITNIFGTWEAVS